jgi:hypothetical protein
VALTLILTASTPGRSPVADADGFTLLVDGQREVTFEVRADPPTWAPQGVRLVRDDEVLSVAPEPGLPRRWVLHGDDRFGTFRATADDAEAILDSVETTVVAAPTPVATALPGAGGAGGAGGNADVAGTTAHESAAAGADGAAPPPGVVDVEVGEYDGRFAGVVAAIFTVLALAVLWSVSNAAIRGFEWGSADSTQAGSYAERSALMGMSLLIAVGSVVLLAGAALAALEVRARQRRTRESARPRGVSESLDKVPAILERAGNLRATIAVLVAGVAVLGLAVLVAVYGPEPGGATTPGPSPAASPTANE